MLYLVANKRIVGNDRQQRAAHLLTCGAHFCPPLPVSRNPIGCWGLALRAPLNTASAPEFALAGLMKFT
jgi:hypothetical protein